MDISLRLRKRWKLLACATLCLLLTVTGPKVMTAIRRRLVNKCPFTVQCLDCKEDRLVNDYNPECKGCQV